MALTEITVSNVMAKMLVKVLISLSFGTLTLVAGIKSGRPGRRG